MEATTNTGKRLAIGLGVMADSCLRYGITGRRRVYRRTPPWRAIALPLAALFVAAHATSLAAAANKTASRAPIRYELPHPALGTTFRVVAYCPDEQSTANVELIVIRRLAELDELLDAGRPSSELSQVYANAGLGMVRVSDELYALLREADKLSGRSDGAYDITAGAVVQLWRDSVEAGRLPTDDEVAAARQLVGQNKFRLNPIDRTAHLTEAGVMLDLDGIVQAYACDRLLVALRQAGFRSALVDAGGCIAVGDPPPGSRGWNIRINDADAKAPHRFVTLTSQAIASSSRLGDHVTIDGQTYARLIHPQIGIGSRNIAPATVVAPRAWQAALLTRAASVAGETSARQLIRATRGAKAWFHYPPDQRPAKAPGTTNNRRTRQPQTLPLQPGAVREIRQTGTIRQ